MDHPDHQPAGQASRHDAPKMTGSGAGSHWRGHPRRVTSYLGITSQPASRCCGPDETPGHEPADQGGNAHGSLFGARGSRASPVQCGGVRRKLTHLSSLSRICRGYGSPAVVPAVSSHPTPSMASTTRVTVVTASTPWMMTTVRGRPVRRGSRVRPTCCLGRALGAASRNCGAWTGIHRVLNMVKAQRGDRPPGISPAPPSPTGGGAEQQMDHPAHQPGQGRAGHGRG